VKRDRDTYASTRCDESASVVRSYRKDKVIRRGMAGAKMAVRATERELNTKKLTRSEILKWHNHYTRHKA
jgi:hypothetical protein